MLWLKTVTCSTDSGNRQKNYFLVPNYKLFLSHKNGLTFFTVVADLVSDDEGAIARGNRSHSKSVPRPSRSSQDFGATREESANNNNSRHGSVAAPPGGSSRIPVHSTPIDGDRRMSDQVGSLDAYQEGRRQLHARNRSHHHDENWSFPDQQVSSVTHYSIQFDLISIIIIITDRS